MTDLENAVSRALVSLGYVHGTQQAAEVISVFVEAELARATPADHSPIGWEYYEEGKLIKTYDRAEKADHAKKMFGGVVRPIFASADHSVPVAIYQVADEDMSGRWYDVREQDWPMFAEKDRRIVYAQPPQNAADHIEAQSVRPEEGDE